MRTILALALSFALCSAAVAHDALLRAGTLAQAKAFLTFLGDTDISFATPYAQGKKGGVDYFLVFAGGGTAKLQQQSGTHVDGFGNTVPTYVNYDSGFWGVIRWQGDLGGFHLPTGIVAYRVDGLAVVASGGDNVTTITDTLNATPQTPIQPPVAVLATATVIP